MIAEASIPEDSRLVDNLMAKEFLSLSFQDRNDINEEMHGVSCLMPIETPELMDESLTKLEHEIGRIPSEEKGKYQLSQERYGTRNSSQEGGSYVNDVDFRMRFLRIELFDAEKSAKKLCQFLDVIVDLFGEYALQRPIRLSDFSEEELQVMRTGNLQLLPFRDRSGRRIITGVEGLAIQFDQTLRIKILYYLMWVAGNDFETQCKGIVVIIWPVSEIAITHLRNHNKEVLVRTQKKQLEGACARVCAFHFCVPPNPFFQVLRSVFAMTLDKKMRSRLKFHTGQMTELQYLVKGYGIPVDLIPLTATGNVKTQNLRVWLKVRSTIENPEGESAENVIECPGSNDVLFRPSKLVKGHPGNVKFHSLIEYYHENGLGITAASKQIISDINEGNGHILVWDKRGWWTKVMDEGQMQFKVSVSYRDFKKKNRAKTQFHHSSTFAFQERNSIKRQRIETDSTQIVGTDSMSSSEGKNTTDTCNFLKGCGSGKSASPVARWRN
eukprot:CAMPEP_0116089196 /NCGR_PEP_ID=MMETSP0327-20121206/6300_1 /TAXON_ID=44447 /ORGANISM="Pseudo-nitzschia delicatissima, Strain B596" /LENGTH=496 /DNA_ID=CAMNT_0003580379 /DNA_START=226 /DNA_END=1716 /DNA_ORIENTATION=-